MQRIPRSKMYPVNFGNAEMAIGCQIERIPRSAPLARFVNALQRDGCVIVRDFTDLDALARAQSEVQPYLDAEEVGRKVGGILNGDLVE